MRIKILFTCLLLSGCGGFPFSNDYSNLLLAAETETPPQKKETKGDTVKSLSPWEADIEQSPPEIKPYIPPTLHGDNVGYIAPRVELEKAPHINSEAVFNAVMNCYPARSTFGGLEVKATGRMTTTTVTSTLDDGNNISGSNYLGIVASIPLYSESEITRRVDREAGRRSDTATAIAAFSEAIARRNQHIRMVSLYRALEKRAAKRVATGIVGATEQIGFLEKVSKSHTALIKAESDILEARLKLVSRCRDSQANKLNTWLKEISKARAESK